MLINELFSMKISLFHNYLRETIPYSYLSLITNTAYFVAKLHKISKTNEWLLKKEMEIPFEIKILLQIPDRYYEYIHIQGKTIGRAKKYCKPERFKRKTRTQMWHWKSFLYEN